jgi:hypothetical protein
MYLITIITANFAEFYVRHQLIVPGDALLTAKNIAASAQLFRLGIVSDMATLVCDVILIAALYVILKPINRNLALLAAFWWLVECSIAAAIIVNELAALRFLGGSSLPTLNMEQVQLLTRLFISMDTAGSRVGALLFGLGSILFCYLWFKSRYIPRWLAAWGIFSSLVPTVIPLATVVFSSSADLPLRRARSGIPIIIFEIIAGLWLLVKQARPAAEAI